MKNLAKVVSLVLIISIILLAGIPSISAAPIKFTDVKSSSWYYTYVNRLVDLKITAGIGNNKYGPNKSVTRAEFVTFLINATGRTKVDGFIYFDTEKHWAKQFISAAAEANIIDKVPNFEPNRAITRFEAVEMLCRALNLVADNTMQTPYADSTLNTPGYSNTAYKEYLMMGSVENGNRYFKPSSNITRAETAAILVNLVDYKANKEAYKSKKQAENLEATKQNEWLKTIDSRVSKELMNNTQGIYGGKTVRECNEYAIKKLESYNAWYEASGVKNIDEFLNKVVEVGSGFMTSYYNRSYLKIDELDKNMKKYATTFNYINFYKNKVYNPTKEYKVISEGEFYTGKGMIFMGQFGPVLRGTLKTRYLAPTNQIVLNKDIGYDNGKTFQLNTWYEYDVEMTFALDDAGLKVTRDIEVSNAKIAR